MFTGLILELGEIISLNKNRDGSRLSLRGYEVIKDTIVGDSIAVNGVCLTVTELRTPNSELFFDVSLETLRCTNLGDLKMGDRVNLEPSLKPNSKMGGHFVTGHVEGVGRIRSKKPLGNAVKIEIETPDNVLKCLIEKGSVAVDGISLTVVDVLRDAFSVVIIPHTLKMTTIGFKNVGDTVNLEPDMLGKYVARFLEKGQGSRVKGQEKDTALLASLKKSGFIS
jgi:riboflavin synthase